jgi:hypothetical protein
VVGVIVNLALFFAGHVLWPQAWGGAFEAPAALIGLLAALALFRFKLGVIARLRGRGRTLGAARLGNLRDRRAAGRLLRMPLNQRRSAVGVGGQPGTSHVDRDDVFHRAAAGVALAEDTAVQPQSPTATTSLGSGVQS